MDSKHSKYLEQLRKAHENSIVDDEVYQDMIKAISCFNENNEFGIIGHTAMKNEEIGAAGASFNIANEYNLKKYKMIYLELKLMATCLFLEM